MASKRNWIAFILYISFYMPQTFSTMLEPSSESSYLTSLSTRSTNNASDITNTSILSQLTSSPSPEAPTGVQETSHISEELNTQFSTRTTVLLDQEDLNRDEHPGTRLPVNASSSFDGDTDSNITLQEIPTTDLSVTHEREHLAHIEQKNGSTSEKKVSYVKSSHEKKQVMSKNPRDLTDKSVTSSISNAVAGNEKNESLEHSWGNESDVNQTGVTDVSDSSVVSEISQALDEHPNFMRTEHSSERRKEQNPRTQDMPFQSLSSQESRTSVNSSTMKMPITDSLIKSEINDSVPENEKKIKNESFESDLLQKSDVKGNDSSDIATDLPANEGHLDYTGNSTNVLSSENLLNSSAYNNVTVSLEEPSSVRPNTNIPQSRRKRSSDHSLASVTELPENRLSSLSYDNSSDVADSTDNPSTETLVQPLPTISKNIDGSAIDGVTLLAVKDTLSKSNLSNPSYATTLRSTDFTSVSEKLNSTINSKNQMLNTVPSEGTEVLESGSTSASLHITSAVDKFDGKGISNISGGDSLTVSTKAFTEKVDIGEDAIASAMPLCKDDDEIDVESTSEISIKVFPLCEKQEVSKAVISVSSSDGNIAETLTSMSIQNPSTEIQTIPANKSERTSESSADSVKNEQSIHMDPEDEEHLKNITVSYKSLGTTESATHPGALQDGDSENSEQVNMPESIPGKRASEGMTVPQNELETKGTEASDALNIEAHSDPNDLMEIEFTEANEKQEQLNDDQANTASPDIIRNVEDYENGSSAVHNLGQFSSNKTDRNFPITKLSLHKSLKESASNTSSGSFDYVADQSEVVPVISYPPSQNISFIENFTARKSVKIVEDTVSTDISVIYPIANITGSDDTSESRQDNESEATGVIKSLENPVQNLSSVPLSEMIVNHTTLVNSDGSGSQGIENIRKSENATSMETKIAGVGVKTTVSVSLNVTKMNSTKMENASTNGLSHDVSPVVTFINLTSSNQKLPSDFIKAETAIDQNVTDSSKSTEVTPAAFPSGISADSSKPPEGTPSPLPQPSTTTKRGFSIRKPRLRLNGESSESTVTRKPFLVRTPPTRASEIVPPMSIFQKNRTRLGSITSSTTQSTTIRASWKPFMGQPITWMYGHENFSFPSEVVTVPTTTEEEVQDADTETVSFSTLSQYDTFRYRVPASIVVRKGINCLSNHFKNKHSPEYIARARKVRKMLQSLFAGTEISHRVLDVKIDAMDCRKTRNITVDYNLYLSKDGSDIKTHELVKVFNSRLENSTFNMWVLDPSATTFDAPHEEAVNTPAPSTEDVEPPIPQWAIAVIVIGAASLVFIILFGALTVYGRHHMRRRYNGSRLGDDDVDRAIDSREWDDKLAATYENLAADGIYDIDDGGFDSVKRGPYGHARHSKVSRHDSWKSDWTERPRRSRYPIDF